MKVFAYYAVPYEAISKLQLIPLSLSATLFPALSEKGALRKEGDSSFQSIYVRAIYMTVLVVLPICLVLTVLSHEILDAWLGGEFPSQSGSTFAILALAAFVQAVGYVPVTALQAMGRADIVGRFYLAEIPIYGILCFLLVPSFGATGAALAWLIRLILIVAVILVVAHKKLSVGIEETKRLKKPLCVNALFGGGMILSMSWDPSVTVSLSVVAVLLVAYGLVGWGYCLDHGDRLVIRRSLKLSS
jgi:O-antigen/teichoic acid export membrane protein